MDVAYELLRVKKMALPRRESCLRSLNNFFAWMSERGECERRQTNWILANWHIKAALEHWERDDMDVDHFFFAGSSVLHRTRSYDEAVIARLLKKKMRSLTKIPVEGISTPFKGIDTFTASKGRWSNNL